VWKLSRVGEKPEADHPTGVAAAITAHGFNSPFEEFSIALDLARRGIPVVYPRAIYMSGLESSRSALYVVDRRRFDSHRSLIAEDGAPLFRPDHNYITIWGYWNGSAEMTDDRDEAHVQPMDLARAVIRGLITPELTHELLARTECRLESAGYRDLQHSPAHMLLSVRHDKSLLLDADGAPAIRLCNFELMQRVSA
jgi:hypothetical protein